MKFDNLKTNDIWYGWNYTHGLYHKMKTNSDDMDENWTQWNQSWSQKDGMDELNTWIEAWNEDEKLWHGWN
jgi:hypothetical protein